MANLLVVDDEVDIREVLTLMLSTAGHAVDTVADGGQALAALDARHYDLVLLDRTMPVLDGLAVLARLRSRAVPSPPVLMVSALTSRADRAAAEAAGARGFLGKPFDRARLLQKVDDLLGDDPEVPLRTA
ncbi:response regulator [Nocardioides sp. GY 10127]|uniref:response regulator n=1 Tax=Nocardioides sp. GY 10127 TaxID=2569762 RepID=UPI0010A8E4D9|nr:response regulator [Nocardioides sp. GY 10127]TIC86403.1 response regulator [Nocardioides sp. GY 10127]